MASFTTVSEPARRMAFFVTFFAACCLGSTNVVFAEKYFPDHPLVQDMVKKGVGFLTSGDARISGEGINLLVGYTIYKVDGNPDQRVVASAIAEAR